MYGETKEKLQEAAKVAGVPVIEVVNTLEEATKKAYEISKEEDIILLSPACASWDQFKNFEIRGDEFIRIVENL